MATLHAPEVVGVPVPFRRDAYRVRTAARLAALLTLVVVAHLATILISDYRTCGRCSLLHGQYWVGSAHPVVNKGSK